MSYILFQKANKLKLISSCVFMFKDFFGLGFYFYSNLGPNAILEFLFFSFCHIVSLIIVDKFH